jgi:hypothetical protein
MRSDHFAVSRMRPYARLTFSGIIPRILLSKPILSSRFAPPAKSPAAKCR